MTTAATATLVDTTPMAPAAATQYTSARQSPMTTGPNGWHLCLTS